MIPSSACRIMLTAAVLVGSEDIPAGRLSLTTHPGGEGRQVEILWQHARIRAERIEPR